ncbi:hypothetical protein GCM10027418_29630 [Mariniluteicoccus endophyticus]
MAHVQPAPRRNPWPIRIAVGCFGLLVLGFLSVVTLVVIAFLPQRGEMGLCRSEGLGASCTDVPAAKIASIMKMELPPGTTVQSSNYVDWQDDVLDAVVVVPAAGVPAWEASLTGWPPATPCALGRCAGIPFGNGQPDQRTYARSDNADGSVTLKLHWGQF